MNAGEREHGKEEGIYSCMYYECRRERILYLDETGQKEEMLNTTDRWR